jgi:hypothetical protein
MGCVVLVGVLCSVLSVQQRGKEQEIVYTVPYCIYGTVNGGGGTSLKLVYDKAISRTLPTQTIPGTYHMHKQDVQEKTQKIWGNITSPHRKMELGILILPEKANMKTVPYTDTYQHTLAYTYGSLYSSYCW